MGYASKHKYDVDISCDFVVLGLTNLIGPLFGCWIVAGQFSRSAVSSNAGARSQVSLFISGFVAVISTILLRSVVFFLLKPALSIIVLFAMVKLMDWRLARWFWQVNRDDFLLYLIAWLATLMF